MTEAALTLGDLGERRIVSELLSRRYANVDNFGDDAALLMIDPEIDGALVATTDPCPPPMAEILGADDPYFAGWLLATLNLSDLAAAGAVPIGLLTSLVLPSSTTLSHFERLLDGIDGCAASVGAQVVGGNLKEGPRDLTATAIGVCPHRQPIRRQGGTPGDEVVVIGDLGSFWAAVLAVQAGKLSLLSGDAALTNVLTPRPKVAAMARLASQGLIRSAIDNSDGLYPTLSQLATASGCSIRVTGARFEFDERTAAIADDLGVDPVRLALGWGDWQVVACCAPRDVAAVQETAIATGTRATSIGALEVAGSGVVLDHAGSTGQMMSLDSQRFTPDSWFSAGIDSYIGALLEAPLVRS